MAWSMCVACLLASLRRTSPDLFVPTPQKPAWRSHGFSFARQAHGFPSLALGEAWATP